MQRQTKAPRNLKAGASTEKPVFSNQHGTFSPGSRVEFQVENQDMWAGPTYGTLIYKKNKRTKKDEFMIHLPDSCGIITIGHGYDAYPGTIRTSTRSSVWFN